MAQKLAINWYYISTHAPRTGSDCYKWYRKHYSCSISTHAPRTGSDAFHQLLPADVEVIFQPTLPARGATTIPILPNEEAKKFQPTLPARGATYVPGKKEHMIYKFQPTLPARGATILPNIKATTLSISTHAPRTGSDATC